MPKLVYSREELLAEHAYARRHKEAGCRLHGGFEPNGAALIRRFDALELRTTA
jgi:hypothetical protein